ncbi:MAG: hypothetical protein M1358_12260 [Chloroflexi bacterium]|nr:hypothetical protein [Chloroflexota bacterium]
MVFFALPRGLGIGLGFAAAEQDLLGIDDLDVAVPMLGLSRDELLAEPYAFIDRFGEYKAPFQVALRIAKLCCQRFAHDILSYVNEEDDAHRQAVSYGHYVSPHTVTEIEFDIDRARAEEWLRKQQPIYALVRTWCGEDAGSLDAL